MIHATFLMEQHIGHRAYYENLRRFVDRAPGLLASWVEITYHDPKNLWQRLPFLPASAKGTAVGRSQAQSGLNQESDVFFFNTQVPAALAGSQVRRRPYVLATDLTPRQYDQMGSRYGHRADRAGWLRQYKHRVNTGLFRGAARLLPWSSWAADSLVRDYGVEPERVEVIPPGVDPEVWYPGSAKNGGPVRILFVGGDFYRKGGETLLRAFRSLPVGRAELVLVTHSRIPEGPGIRVFDHLRPNSAELISLFRSSHLFALPTEAEAFGIAAIEASAAGLPVIASRVGGLPDIVEDGATGFLVPPGDAEALAACLHALVDRPDLRARFGKAARERALTYFDARKNAGRVAEILMEIGKN